MSKITDLKRKKLSFEQETGQVYTYFWDTKKYTKKFKTTARRKINKKIKIKNNGIYNTYHYCRNG